MNGEWYEWDDPDDWDTYYDTPSNIRRIFTEEEKRTWGHNKYKQKAERENKKAMEIKPLFTQEYFERRAYESKILN